MGRNPTRYRALLPTTPRGDQPAAGQIAPLFRALDSIPKRKSTRIACKECHEKKRKCDGRNPSCTACVRQGQRCTYRAPSTTSNELLRDELEELRGRYDTLESLVTQLRVATPPRALEALRQLRASPSGLPMDLDKDKTVQQPGFSRSPSAAVDSPSTGLETATCVEPSEAGATALNQGPSIEEPRHVALEQIIQGARCDQMSCGLDLDSALSSDTSAMLFKQVSDPRLAGLDISFWTVVPVTDLFATDAISSYLRSDHRIWELFDADTFLSDLVNQKSNFCSAFLVNCLLAFASQTYGPDDPSAITKGFQFEEEAGILWQAEATRLDSETALTGLILLYLCFTARWESNNADDCLREVFEMAVRMRLFGVEERISDTEISLLKADRRSAMIHAAWGAFNTMRKRRLGDVTSLPPLVSTPGMFLAREPASEDFGGHARKNARKNVYTYRDQLNPALTVPRWPCIDFQAWFGRIHEPKANEASPLQCTEVPGVGYCVSVLDFISLASPYVITKGGDRDVAINAPDEMYAGSDTTSQGPGAL
ncbi:hypothetical protein J7T55_013722 [Diaporthe amygdali]|uniref:uncharacterized protein n=1 Tax=Phomopsis amygdali TaxID=1214568 RepID=UPI0022FE7D09|nr:uncharacterized protein J7T55_013722 [Diaporthe amygdali]KAJ0119520.1 hypothetical protein J7T55_013722 [Diaporthe amygdali]